MAERGNREISGLASEEVAETPACLGADLAAAGMSENGDDLAEGWAWGFGESTKAANPEIVHLTNRAFVL